MQPIHQVASSWFSFTGQLEVHHHLRPARAYLDGKGPITRHWHRKWEALRPFYRFAITRGLVRRSPLPTHAPKLDTPFTAYIYTQDELRALLQAGFRYRLANNGLTTAPCGVPCSVGSHPLSSSITPLLHPCRAGCQIQTLFCGRSPYPEVRPTSGPTPSVGAISTCNLLRLFRALPPADGLAAVGAPDPHSTPSTTRSRVCTGFTFSQPAPRRPASYGAVGDFAITPSWPAARVASRNRCAASASEVSNRSTR